MTTTSKLNAQFHKIVAGTDVNGNVTSLVVQDNIAANTYTGNGALLTNVVASNAQQANTANIASVANISYSVDGANVVGVVGGATTAFNVNAASTSNVIIGGGTSGQYLQTDGSGGLTWATVSISNVANANYANFAGTAYSVEASNVANLTQFIANSNSNVSNVALAVEASNVANLTQFIANSGSNTANVATTANTALALNTDIANVIITGGANLSVLSTDGTGNLSWRPIDEVVHVHESAHAATTASFATLSGGLVTYTVGPDPLNPGVGATLTLANPVNKIDNHTLAAAGGDRILVKNEANAVHNGIYVSSATPHAVYTRATDFDQTGEVDGGDFVFVTNGVQYGGTGWIETNYNVVVGTDPIVWQQFSAVGTQYTAGTGLDLTGTVFSIANTTVVANTYGTATTVPQITVNQQGQLTGVVDIPIVTSAVANSTSNVSIPVADGSIELWVAGNWVGNIATDESNVTSNFSAGGNISGANLTTSGGISGFDINVTDLYVNGGYANLGDVAQVHITGGNIGEVLTTDGTGILTWSAPLNKKYSKEWHVDPVNGSDLTGDGSYNKPFLTVGKALTSTGPAYAAAVYLHGGIYSEIVNIASPVENVEIIGINNTSTSVCSGTWTFGHTGTSIRVRDLRFTNTVTQTSTGAVYFDNCTLSSFAKSGASYTQFDMCDVVSTSYTSAANTVFRGGTINGLTINNVAAAVYVYNMTSVVTTTVTNGIFAAFDSMLYSATPTTNAITSSAGTTVAVYRSQITNGSATPSRVSLAGNWTINDSTYDIANSTLTGTNLGTVSYFDALNIRGVSTLGAIGNVKITGGTSGQILSTDGTGNLSWSSGTLAPANLIAVNSCVGGTDPIPTGNTNDVRTVGTTGTFATLAAAIADSSVVAGTILRLVSNLTLTATLVVSKSVIIDLNGFTINTAADGTAPVTMISVTAANAVIRGGTLSHLKTTNTSVETVVSCDAVSVFVVNCTINIQEIGVACRQRWMVSGCTFNYVGASLTNSHRFIIIYSVTGESRVTGCIYNCSPQQATVRYSNFVYFTSTTGSAFTAPLYITNNIQGTGDLRQFYFQDANFTSGQGAQLIVDNNIFNDFNGGIGLFNSTSPLNAFSKIVITNNTQGNSSAGNFKGLFFVDGSGTLGTTTLQFANNTTTAGPLRVDYITLVNDSTNLLTYKTSFTPVSLYSPTTVSTALNDTATLLSTFKAARIVVGTRGGNVNIAVQ